MSLTGQSFPSTAPIPFWVTFTLLHSTHIHDWHWEQNRYSYHPFYDIENENEASMKCWNFPGSWRFKPLWKTWIGWHNFNNQYLYQNIENRDNSYPVIEFNLFLIVWVAFILSEYELYFQTVRLIAEELFLKICRNMCNDAQFQRYGQPPLPSLHARGHVQKNSHPWLHVYRKVWYGTCGSYALCRQC